MKDLIKTSKDLRQERWWLLSSSSGTAGALMKTIRGGVYYKLSSYNAHDGFYGNESVNELIVSRLLDRLNIPHVRYRLEWVLVRVGGSDYETWACKSSNYRLPGESRVRFESYYELWKHPGESPLAFCVQQGWSREISQMMIADFIVQNRDRHGSNTEVLIAPDGTARLAPIFDFGMSLFCYHNRRSTLQIADAPVMEDVAVNNYIGTNSLFRNLGLLPEKPALPLLSERDYAAIFAGLDTAVDAQQQLKIRKMIEKRCAYYAEIQGRSQEPPLIPHSPS